MYANSDIDALMLDYVEKDMKNIPLEDKWHVSREYKINIASLLFMNTVKKLRHGLDILDSRIITSISGRISSFQNSDDNRPVWNLVRVHRYSSQKSKV